MAIDSRLKRTSAAGLPFMLLFPKPDEVISITDRMMMAGMPATLSWVSVDSHDASCDATWDDCANAYDDDPATYAIEAVAGDTEWLILEWNTPLRVDAYRFLGMDDDPENGEENPVVAIEFYSGGGWRWGNVFTPTKDVWYEKEGVGTGLAGLSERISKVRLRSFATNAYYLSIAGFQVRSLGEFYPAASRPLAGGSMNVTPLIKGGLVR